MTTEGISHWPLLLSPPWRAHRKYQFSGEAVVHRVVVFRSIGYQVHDETVLGVTLVTGCGLKIGDAMSEHLESAGFRHAHVVLTCLVCASGLRGDGDRMAGSAKELLLGAMYGVDPAQLAKHAKQYASPASQLVEYCHADAEAMLGLLKAPRARIRLFSREFRHRLARRLLP